MENQTVISRYPAPTQEIANNNDVIYFRFYVIAKLVVSFTKIQSNTEIFPEKFIVNFFVPNYSEIRFGCSIQHSKTYTFDVAIKDNATSYPVSYLNINITQENYERLKEVSEMLVKNQNEQFSVQLHLDLLNTLNIEHLDKLDNLFKDSVNLKK